MNVYSEKTIKDMEWKRADTYEWKCRVFNLRFSIVRIIAGVWELRLWDETAKGWKSISRHERGRWSSSRWDVYGPPYGLKLVATQQVWNIVKSQPDRYQRT